VQIPSRFLLLGLFVIGSEWLGGCATSAVFQHPWPKSEIDMPVSLAPGVVKTTEFRVINDLYYIMLQADGVLPHEEMMCGMGLFNGPSQRQYYHCNDDDPSLRADWKVLDEDRAVKHGSSPLDGYGKWSKTIKIKVLGDFVGEAGKKYVVEVEFTKDGTALNAANPHLIVVLYKYH
jgi:hypothetical protein